MEQASQASSFLMSTIFHLFSWIFLSGTLHWNVALYIVGSITNRTCVKCFSCTAILVFHDLIILVLHLMVFHMPLKSVWWFDFFFFLVDGVLHFLEAESSSKQVSIMSYINSYCWVGHFFESNIFLLFCFLS